MLVAEEADMDQVGRPFGCHNNAGLTLLARFAAEPDKDWKVKLAKRVKERALAKGIDSFSEEVVERWVRLFNAFAENAA